MLFDIIKILLDIVNHNIKQLELSKRVTRLDPPQVDHLVSQPTRLTD